VAEARHQWFLNRIFRHRAALARHLRKLTSSSENIDDLIQETYLRVYSLPAHDRVESPRALLFSIAHNLCIERARRTSPAGDCRDDSCATGFDPSGALADVPLDERRRFESFCAALEQLSPLCRRVFVLRKVYRLSHDEIAEVLCVSHATIEMHVVKGLLRCRDHLQRAGLLDSEELRPNSRPPTRLRDRGDRD
jgi:RNA polymerase sigma factor (sigma-70 family)